MPRLQELIHTLELGAGARYVRLVTLFLAIVTMAVAYNLRELQNLRSEEAMDSAQVARNLAEGRGFTTRYVRPVSMGLVMRHSPDRDPQVRDEHPDLANAPLYPLLLAGVMKIPGVFNYEIVSPKEGEFRRHQPDLAIAVINQVLFFIAILLTYRLARRLFDTRVAVITALTMLGSDLLWQFSASGLSTMLALVLLAALANVVVSLDAGVRSDPPAGTGRFVALAAIAGLLCGLLALTRYSFAVTILPVLVFLIAGFPGRRAVLPLVAGVVFLTALTPWCVRNYQICGNPFGIAPYSLAHGTPYFTENWLERTLEPDVSKIQTDDLVRKFFVGAGHLLRDDLPQLGGSYLTAFFLVGLLIPFVEPGRSRLRWFSVGLLALLAVAQIVSRTHLSTDVPRINSENLIVVASPLVFMFGAALIVLLVNTIEIQFEAWRTILIAVIVGFFWLPLIVTFGPPRTMPIAYPPYYPPTIQRVAQWFGPKEWIMTDMPWAVAWYGNRQALLLTPSPDQEFLEIHDWQKPVNAVYLTRITLDKKFITDWVLDAVRWGRFIIEILTRGKVPQGFPLVSAPTFTTTFPDHILLADRERWSEFRPLQPPKELDKPEEPPRRPATPEATPAAEGAKPVGQP